jgi:hypothetical protein
MSYKLSHIAALKETEIDENDLHAFLTSLFAEDQTVLKSSQHKSIIKKLIRIYDWKKYKK